MVSGNGLYRAVIFIHLNGMFIGKFGKTMNHIDLVIFEAVVVRLMNTADISLATLYQFGKVKLFNIQIKAIVRRIMMYRCCHVGAIPHHFFGYTAHIDASTA